MEHIDADDDRTDGAAFAPSDNTTLTSVLAGLESEGFTGHFTAMEGGHLRCDVCEGVRRAGEYEVISIRRMEGASEPDEMMSVVAAVCPRCGGRGVAVLGYGPNASAADADVSIDLASDATQASGAEEDVWPDDARG